jgi:hypothetical protein
MTLDDLLNFLISPPQTPELQMVKAIFLFFTFALVAFIIWSFFKSTFLRRLIIWDLMEILSGRAFKLGEYARRWEKIELRLAKKAESEAKLAILEADSLLEEVLRKSGYPGETLGEKLEKLDSKTLPNLEEVKKAHRVKNSIVEDPAYRLTIDEAEKNLKIYKRALTYLEAL